MKLFFLFTSVAVLIFACKKTNQEVLETNYQAMVLDTSDYFFEEESEGDKEEVVDQIYIVKEEFVLRPFEFNPTLENLSISLSNYEFTLDTLVDNVFSDSVTYYKLALMNSEFIFVQGFLNGLPANFLAGAKISDEEVKLASGVKIGMSKEEFYQIFKDERIYFNDVIAVGDRENNSVFEFHFDNEKLVEINYLGYIG